jgi:hypothetical protein
MEKATFLRGPTWHQISTGQAKLSKNTQAVLQGGYQEVLNNVNAYQKSEGWSQFASTKAARSLQGKSTGSWSSRSYGMPANNSVSKEGALFKSAPRVPTLSQYKKFSRPQRDGRENAAVVSDKPTWLEVSRGKARLSPNTQAILQGGYQEDWTPFTKRRENAAFQHNNYRDNVSAGDQYAMFRRNQKETFNQNRGPLGSAKRPYYYSDFPRFSNYIPRTYETTYPVYSFRRY